MADLQDLYDLNGLSITKKVGKLLYAKGDAFKLYNFSFRNLERDKRIEYFEEVILQFSEEALKTEFEIIEGYIQDGNAMFYGEVDIPRYSATWDSDKRLYAQEHYYIDAHENWLERRKKELKSILEDAKEQLSEFNKDISSPRYHTFSRKKGTNQKLKKLFTLLSEENHIEKRIQQRIHDKDFWEIFKDAFSGKMIGYQPKIVWKHDAVLLLYLFDNLRVNWIRSVKSKRIEINGVELLNPDCDYSNIMENSQIFVKVENGEDVPFRDFRAKRSKSTSGLPKQHAIIDRIINRLR